MEQLPWQRVAKPKGSEGIGQFFYDKDKHFLVCTDRERCIVLGGGAVYRSAAAASA